MEKEEILRRAKEENIYGDEMEKDTRTRKAAFSIWGAFAISIFIIAVKLFRDETAADNCAVIVGMAAAGSFYEFIRTKKKALLFPAVTFFVLTIYYLFQFLSGVN